MQSIAEILTPKRPLHSSELIHRMHGPKKASRTNTDLEM